MSCLGFGFLSSQHCKYNAYTDVSSVAKTLSSLESWTLDRLGRNESISRELDSSWGARQLRCSYLRSYIHMCVCLWGNYWLLELKHNSIMKYLPYSKCFTFLSSFIFTAALQDKYCCCHSANENTEALSRQLAPSVAEKMLCIGHTSFSSWARRKMVSLSLPCNLARAIRSCVS